MTRYVQDDNAIFNFKRPQLFLSLWGRIVPVDLYALICHCCDIFSQREKMIMR